jgi:ATP/maltotriose-dependent transcriptional regulator MalT
MPFPRALQLCRDLAKEALEEDDDRWTAVAIAVFRAFIEAHAGDYVAARASYEEAGPLLEELGTNLFLTSQRFFAGRVELLAANPVAAEAHFRDAIQLLEGLGDRGGNLAGPLVYLAEALHAQGADEEAEQSARSGLELGNRDDLEAQIAGRSILAELLLAAGKTGEAEALAREAVGLSDHTDSPLFQADARRTLALVLRAADGPAEGEGVALDALSLYEAKGSLAGAESIRRVLGTTPITPPERTGTKGAAPPADRPDRVSTG